MSARKRRLAKPRSTGNRKMRHPLGVGAASLALVAEEGLRATAIRRSRLADWHA